MPHYIMIADGNTSNDPTNFNRMVNEYLERGYELYGPPMTTMKTVDDSIQSGIEAFGAGDPIATRNESSIVFSQALYKP